MTYFFDASAIYSIIEEKKKDALQILKDGQTTSLAVYEMGNIAWKHVMRKTISQAEGLDILKVVENLPKIIKIKELDAKDISEIFKDAESHNISFYDASYYYYAKENKSTLVTDDGKLMKAIKQEINVIGSNEI